MRHLIVLWALFLPLGWLQAQVNDAQPSETYSLSGLVVDFRGNSLPGATVVIGNASKLSTATNSEGQFTVNFPHSGPWEVLVSFVGYESQRLEIQFDEPSQFQRIRLRQGLTLGEAEVRGDGPKDVTIQRIDPKIASRIPTPRGSIEDVLIQAPVNFTSELSSAYNVRGGSFDENLVYVNDIEVYRPFLVRSGQQEGLSFANPDMVDRIEFSAGGFESKYGDKLSSVLDIHYRKPTSNATRVTASAMGAQLQHDHVAGPVQLNLGARYRNNSYVLSTLDERGEYAPTYLDGQCYATWDPDGYGPWEIQALGV